MSIESTEHSSPHTKHGATPSPLTHESAERATKKARLAPRKLWRANRNVISQEESRRFDINGEAVVQALQLSISQISAGIHTVTIIHVHNEVHSRAISQNLEEIARVTQRLPC